jgi:acetyl-CoA synthetase
MKPGTCGPGVLGIYPVIWGQPERFVDTYYRKYNQDPDSTDWRDWP